MTAKMFKVLTVNNTEGLEAGADQYLELFRENGELPDEHGCDYDDYVDGSLWWDEELIVAQHEKSEDCVNIVAHVLCTPVSLHITGSC